MTNVRPRKLVLVAGTHNNGTVLAKSLGLLNTEFGIITEGNQLQGLEGVRRNPIYGMFAVYSDCWWRHRSDQSREYLIEMLISHGFNCPAGVPPLRSPGPVRKQRSEG